MAGIINPAGPQIRYVHRPLASAQPVVTQLQTADGLTILVAGGVTVRQQLAATVLSGSLAEEYQIGDRRVRRGLVNAELSAEERQSAVTAALALADELIRQTADDWRTP